MTTPDENPHERTPSRPAPHESLPGEPQSGNPTAGNTTSGNPTADAPIGDAAGAGSTRRGSYGEIAPGVPRYGQYAPEGWVSPASLGSPDAGSSLARPAASTYPGFAGSNGPNTGLPHRGPGPLPPGVHFAAPRPVVWASRLIMAAGALQLVSALLLMAVLFLPTARTTVVDALKSAMPSDPSYAQLLSEPAFVTSVLVIAAIVSLLGAVIYFGLAAKIRKGANWARITALVLAAVSLLGLVQPNYLAILQIGLGVIAVAILFRSPAKEYFAGPAKGPRGY